MTGAELVARALNEARRARDELDNAEGALEDAITTLSRMDPQEAVRTVDRLASGQVLHLCRVGRSLVNQDGVFDLMDLALATDDAERALLRAAE